MPSRDARSQDAIHFLRERLHHVAGSQPSLYMRHRNLLVESPDRARQRGCGVALHQDQVRMLGLQNGLDRGQNVRREAGQRLARPHQIEIVVGRYGKGRENLVQHVAMLRRHADFHREFIWPRAQPVNQRTQLDALRARSEDAENADHRRRTFTRVGRHKVPGGTKNTAIGSVRFRKKPLGTR